MTFKERIRAKLDTTTPSDNFEVVAKELISEGISGDELMEIIPDIVKSVAKTRGHAPFFTPPQRPSGIQTSSSAPLLPKAVPVKHTGSDKVKGYQSSRLDELYPVGSGKYKKLSEMNREDIRFNVRMLEGKQKALQGRIKGWNKILDQLQSYKVNVVQELPDDVKEKI